MTAPFRPSLGAPPRHVEPFPEPPAREFNVYLKDKGPIHVRADTIKITESGTLVFHLQGNLINAFSPGSGWWLEEI